jgi:hypothetical protein
LAVPWTRRVATVACVARRSRSDLDQDALSRKAVRDDSGDEKEQNQRSEPAGQDEPEGGGRAVDREDAEGQSHRDEGVTEEGKGAGQIQATKRGLGQRSEPATPPPCVPRSPPGHC